VSNPIVIAAGALLPRPLILPAGFVPNQPFHDEELVIWPAGKPITREVVIPGQSGFPLPFVIPNGLPLSNKWSPTTENQGNGTLYIIPGFWNSQHTARCQYPCTMLFPPVTKTTTWIPPPATFSTTGWTTTVTPPSDPGSQATKVVAPVPAVKPLCIPVNVVTTTIYIFPPDINPFPPVIPMVTIGPVPPGGRPEPVSNPNKPSPEQQQVGVFCDILPTMARLRLLTYRVGRGV
jgi:hypothetical protein